MVAEFGIGVFLVLALIVGLIAVKSIRVLSRIGLYILFGLVLLLIIWGYLQL